MIDSLERIHLTIIREVDRKGTLTAAAAVLGLTQPALSHSIAKLEQQLETEIWTRQGRHLRLTPAGKHLLALAHRLLPQLEHAESVVRQYGDGQRGSLRFGMECHPCYQWLLKVVSPYLKQWPKVELDVKQKFQFGGIGALFAHEIDMLVTPDPLRRKGLRYEAVFDYEQVLVVSQQHSFAGRCHIEAKELSEEVLITYPVEVERLDVYSQFLLPKNYTPRKHKVIETTDIMLQMVASGRGVAALPRWLVEEYSSKLPITSVRLGKKGIAKQIFLGFREEDADIDYLKSFLELARST